MKINYELEAIFLRDVVDTLDRIKLVHDQKRDMISATINNVFNGQWSRKNEDIKRGVILGVLKGGETAMNETFVKIAKLELLVKDRLGELYACKDNEDINAIKKQRIKK